MAETFGITTCALNDDRIARALDAIAPELDQVVGSVGARAISSVRAGGGPVALGHDLCDTKVAHASELADWRPVLPDA